MVFNEFKKEEVEKKLGFKLTEEFFNEVRWTGNDCNFQADEYLKLLETKEGLVTIIVKMQKLYTKKCEESSDLDWDKSTLTELLKKSGSIGRAFYKLFDKKEKITEDDKSEIIDGIMQL